MILSNSEIKSITDSFVKEHSEVRNVLLVGPDFTRFFSNAGFICNCLYHGFKEIGARVRILEALGTHIPMTEQQCNEMYGDIPFEAFVAHNWKNDVITLGQVPSSFLADVTEGLWNDPVNVQINKLIMDPLVDLIVSVGQVVPHEVVGMANHAKNLFVGVGGNEMINASHMIGAVYGMERMMGKDITPVRKLFDYALENFLKDRPIWFMLTVCTAPQDKIHTHGLFVGNTRKCFEDAVELSQKYNIDFVDTGIKKCVVYLNPKEFNSTWLGNKSIYRTRMAIADGGELIILAPGVEKFGEDPSNDAIIRKYGYRGRINTLEQYRNNKDLRDNAGAAAHLIHGSSDGRFSITYAVKKEMKQAVESVGFNYADYEETAAKYDISKLKYGYNEVDGEQVYFIPNPALGLWINREKF